MAQGINISVKVIDHGWDDIRKRVLLLGTTGGTVTVGVQGAEAAAQHQDGKLTMGQIATIHEFGKVIQQPKMHRTITIPERSFIRATVDMFQEAITRREVLIAQGVLYGKFALRQGLELFGTYVVNLIKQRIADGIPPKNSDWTIARKGSSKPLIDTGQLRGSITYKVGEP